MGAYGGHEIAEAKGYDMGDWQTYGYMLGGAIIGGGTAYLGIAMPAAGFSYLETAFVTSHLSNMGWLMMTGGQSDIVYGYGPFTYNITDNDFSIGWGPVEYNVSEGEWDYLGEKGNTWQDNLRFGIRTAGTIYKHREMLFSVDKSKSALGQAWQVTSRLTWEAPQTVLGMMAYDLSSSIMGYESKIHKGIAYWYSSKMSGAMTLGGIFIEKGMNEKYAKDIVPHEYGHTIQSRILGPAYLPAVGLPSIIRAALFQPSNPYVWEIYWQDYNNFYTERWATNLGIRYY